jgi:uncharacterized protein (DUF362 family)/Pyruvate/2-oxoacid:ferredoxin oxidoreductase delta subunit
LAEVSLIRCPDYDSEKVTASVRKAVDLLGGMGKFVKMGDRVLLKPNLLLAQSPEKSITTHPEVIRAVSRLVREAGGRLFLGDSPALDSFKRAAAKAGIGRMAEEEGIELLPFSRPVRVPPREEMHFKNVEVASQVLDADVVINLPKLKTHAQMLLTLGVKNMFGAVVAQRKAEWHLMAGVDRDTFASLLLDIYGSIRPALTVLDGVWGMDGRGPANGRPRPLNLIAASTDAVSLDTVICRWLGIPLSSFPVYRVAKRRGIGGTDGIALKGDPISSWDIRDFQTPSLDSLGFLPDFFDWFTKHYLVSKPVQREGCIGCGRCAEICPAKAASLERGKITFNYERCIRCYCCQEICPQDAIGFKRGILVRMLNRFHR